MKKEIAVDPGSITDLKTEAERVLYNKLHVIFSQHGPNQANRMHRVDRFAELMDYWVGLARKNK